MDMVCVALCTGKLSAVRSVVAVFAVLLKVIIAELLASYNFS